MDILKKVRKIVQMLRLDDTGMDNFMVPVWTF